MFWREIKPSETIKISLYMVAKLDFSKGLVHDFGQKLEIFCLFFSLSAK